MLDSKTLLRVTQDRIAAPKDVMGSLERRRQRHDRNRRVGSAVVALLVIGATVGGLLRALSSSTEPAVDLRSAFLGTWVSTESDGSNRTMVIRASENEAVTIVVHDDGASVCSGGASTMTGTGGLVGPDLVITSPTLTCDDGSEPVGPSGPPLEERLRDMTFVHHPKSDTLTDNFEAVWVREGAEVPEPPTPAVPSPNPDVFTEIAPGEMVELPDWPLGERTTPPRVWTGTELIVWGDGIYGRAGDGAAFDLATGTWRVIAQSPLSPRSEAAVAWTGTEMIVWGGRVEDSFYYDGAAYDPVNDSWRLLPSAPAGFDARDPTMVWTGREAVVLGQVAAAYDPVSDRWRTLAVPPFEVHGLLPTWWTGDSIVVAAVGYGPKFDRMARYDWAADRWTTVDVGPSATVVGVPDSEGRVSTFLSLPYKTGAPVRLIGTAGDLIAELPAFPGDRGVFGDRIGASGLWVGDEAVFEIWMDGPGYEPEQIWALNPSTQTWRRLDGDTAFPRIDLSALAIGDLLLMPNRPGDAFQGPPTTSRSCCVAPPSRGGSIYRVGTTSSSEAP